MLTVLVGILGSLLMGVGVWAIYKGIQAVRMEKRGELKLASIAITQGATPEKVVFLGIFGIIAGLVFWWMTFHIYMGK